MAEVASHAKSNAITQSAVRPGWVLVSNNKRCHRRGTGHAGNRHRHDERLALPRLAEDAAAIGRRKHHADADQEQHQATSDADGIGLQLHDMQELLATEQEHQQDAQRDQQFAHHDAAATARRHFLEQAQEERNIAQRVHDQEQHDPRRQRGHLCFHLDSLRNGLRWAGDPAQEFAGIRCSNPAPTLPCSCDSRILTETAGSCVPTR